MISVSISRTLVSDLITAGGMCLLVAVLMMLMLLLVLIFGGDRILGLITGEFD